MSPRTVVMMVVAIACGGAAAFMTKNLLADRQEMVKVLIAKQKITAYTVIKEPGALFVEQSVPKAEAKANALSSYVEVLDRTTKKSVEPLSQLTNEMLLDKDHETLDTMIEPGYVADSVSVTADKVVGGFVQPGTRVNIIHTVNRNNDKEPEAKPILSNIKIVAVDQQPTPAEGGRPASVPQTVTMQLKPEEALKLERAKIHGSIALILRAAGDTAEMVDTPKKVEEVVSLPTKTDVAVTPRLIPAEKQVTLIYNGNSMIRATHVKKDGQYVTDIERTTVDAPPAPRAPETPAPTQPIIIMPQQPTPSPIPGLPGINRQPNQTINIRG